MLLFIWSNGRHFIRLYHHDKKSFFISLLVAFITIYEDPIIGILVGTVVSLLLFVEKLSEGHYELTHDEIHDTTLHASYKAEKHDALVYSIKGKLVYLNSQAHMQRFESNLISYKTIILKLGEVYFIDLDGSDALDEIIELIERRGQKVMIVQPPPFIDAFLKKTSKQYDALEKHGSVFKRLEDALHHA